MVTSFGQVLHERWRPEDGENTQWFRLCTPKKDSFGTCIEPMGAKLERYYNNPVFLWMHQSGPKASSPQTPGPEAVIGRTKQIDQQRDHMDILVEFDVQEEMARRCLRKTKDGYLRAVSIGFDPVKVVPTTVSDSATAERYGVSVGQVVPVITEWTLMEASLVIVGSNADALKLMRSIDPTEPAPAESAPVVAVEERAHVTGHVVEYKSYGLDRGPWDAAAEEEKWFKVCVGNKDFKDATPVERKRYSEMFAWVAGDGTTLADYKLPHHSVHQGHLLTNLRGVTAALAALHGARGGIAIPAAHRKAVEHHLMEHEKEFTSATRAHLHGSHATLPPGGGNVSTTTEGQRETKMKMHPEHRWIARSLIGSHMRAAADHMTGMAHCGPGMEGLHKAHQEAATQHMEHAHRMAGHLREYMDDDDDDMRMAKLPAPRSIDSKAGNAELRARFAEVSQFVHRFDVRMADEAAASALGLSLSERGVSDKIEARIEGFKLVQEKYTTLATQARQQREDGVAAERAAIVNQLLDGAIITPHLAQRMLGKVEGEQAWSLAKISETRATLGDLPIVPITGVRALDPAAPPASVPAAPAGVQERGAAPTTQPTFAAPTVPAQAPIAPSPGAQPVAQGRAQVIAQAIRNTVGATDLNLERITMRAQLRSAQYSGDYETERALQEKLNEKRTENERYWEGIVRGTIRGEDQVKPRNL